MVRYAVRALPWTRVLVAASLVLVLMDVVRRWPWAMWPLEGTAVGLLAAAAGWCFDEQAAAVVDPAPRGLAWRTTARASGVLVLLAVWAVAVWSARHSLFDHPWAVAMQGVAGVLAALAWTAWRRSIGERSPGTVSALSVVPLATAWALVRPFGEDLPVFPYGTNSSADWTASLVGWSAVAIAAALVSAAVLADVAWWRLRSQARPRTVDSAP